MNASANPGTGGRTASVTVTIPGVVTRSITVTQGAQAASLSLSHGSWNPSFGAESLTVNVFANRAWNVSSNATSWLTVTPASGNGNGSFRINVTANNSAGARSGTITATMTGATSRTVTVTQGAPAANLSLSHSTWNPSFAADSLTVTVTANRAWNVSSNATSWLTVTPASGNGNGSFRINTTANTGTAARSGTITATIPGVVSRTITVTQAFQPVGVPSAPRNLSITHAVGQATLSWIAPASNGGASIARYEVALNNGGWTAAQSMSSHTFTGLTSAGTGRHTLRVRAVNSAGAGEQANVLTVQFFSVTFNPNAIAPTWVDLPGDIAGGGTYDDGYGGIPPYEEPQNDYENLNDEYINEEYVRDEQQNDDHGFFDENQYVGIAPLMSGPVTIHAPAGVAIGANNIPNPGFAFTGWFTPNNEVIAGSFIPTANVTAFPRVSLNVMVTFNPNGGRLVNEDDWSREVVAGAPILDLPQATKESHTFVGWNTKASGNGDFITSGSAFSENETVWAIWRIYSSLITPFFQFYGELGWLYPLLHPESRYIGSGYRLPRRLTHEGIDIRRDEPNRPHGAYGAIIGELVYAMHCGEVVVSGWSNSAGWWVVIRSETIDPVRNRYLTSRYLHMRSTPLVREGAEIIRGTPIGRVGNSGNTRGSGPGGRSSGHLHIDVNNNDRHSGIGPYTINPERFFPHIEFTGLRSTVTP